jgi:hypothetical protein
MVIVSGIDTFFTISVRDRLVILYVISFSTKVAISDCSLRIDLTGIIGEIYVFTLTHGRFMRVCLLTI